MMSSSFTYATLTDTGHSGILPVSSSLGPGSTVTIKVKRAKQKLGEGKLGSRAWRPAFDAAICLSAIITLTDKTILGKKKKKHLNNV